MSDYNDWDRMDRAIVALHSIAKAIAFVGLCTLALAAALMLGGCMPEPTINVGKTPRGEGVAIELARMTFAADHGALPQHTGEVLWTQDECVWFEGMCVDGAFQTYTDTIYLVDKGGIWQSALAHELVHYWLDKEGDSDHEHEREDWWELVGCANEAMRVWEERAAEYGDGCQDGEAER